MSQLPNTAFEAKRLAAPRAVLRVVPHGERPDVLPSDSGAFVGPGTSPVGMVLKPVLMVAVTVAFVWIVTVNAWDDEGFFPWFWNPVWVVFPWVFLTPLWVGFLRSLARKPANDRFRKSYRTLRSTTAATVGRVVDVRLTRADSGGIADYVVAVDTPGGDLVVGRIAPSATFAPHEAPEPGDTVHVWRMPDGWTLVQAARGRQRPAATSKADAFSLAAELEQLAELHSRGDLTDEQFDQANTRLLSR
ncbi:hypothetical protein Q7F20_01380 [Curtobacterium sp. A7_M15]|uniref:SHOCT domain-containing protein n=1 Tax=Curtobacterium sp. A7_M15 TaxID=3065241 RepID=UPI002738029E|nr:hypothetical protein [Curtobacterium sp. A7_M15]MDP4332010.1 hypothetical protein [Curtobacterium sp. A7_M15]